jgi:hypothetical protein
VARIDTRFAVVQQVTSRLRIGTTAAVTALAIQALGDHQLADVAGVAMVSTSTNLTTTLNWTDPDGGAQTFSWYTAAARTKGPAQLAQQQILIQAGTTATVEVTTTVSGAVRSSLYGRHTGT